MSSDEVPHEPGPSDLLRTDQVGSLLRPAFLKESWARYDRGELDEEGLAASQRTAVGDVIARQVAHGAAPLTDGEFWRRSFQETFSRSVSGYTAADASYTRGGASPDASGQIPEVSYTRRQPVNKRLELVHNRLADEYREDRAFTDAPLKVTLIGPERIGQRFDVESSSPVYPDVDAFVADVVAIERQIIAEVVELGCGYIHIDEPSYTAYVDGPSLEEMRARGLDPATRLEAAIAADNAVIEGFPGVTFGLHICRGNAAGAWHREGTYDAIAEQLFSSLHFDRLLLEYDSERAGGFEPLRFVPKGTVAVLGLVTTKSGELETLDDLLRRFEEATTYLSSDQLAVSPQCGFASGVMGNPLSEADQWRKLERVAELASAIWG